MLALSTGLLSFDQLKDKGELLMVRCDNATFVIRICDPKLLAKSFSPETRK